MAHNNPYAVPFQQTQYAPGTQSTVSGRNREDQQKSDADIKLHVEKNNNLIALGKHASPHAQQARRAAWNAHDAAPNQAQNWETIRAEQQQMQNELKKLENEFAEFQKQK